MVVMILERVKPSLRGELTRWMMEVTTGVFVGTMSAVVRDLLWEKVRKSAIDGRCCLIHRTNNEQGFDVRMWGFFDRDALDFDGLKLISVLNARWSKMQKRKSQEAPSSLTTEDLSGP